MNELELPEWVVRLRKTYESDPVKWMWIGMTALVLVIIVGLVAYMIRRQKTEAAELLADGLVSLDAGNYQAAMQDFQRIETSHKLSGYRDEARLYSAAALFGLGRYNEALDAYSKFVQDNPKSELAPQAELSIGACFEMRGDTAAALRGYQAAREKYKGSFLEKALEIRIARLSRLMGDAKMPGAIYDALEKDTEGLWKEIARGNRRMIATAPEPTASDTASRSASSGR